MSLRGKHREPTLAKPGAGDMDAELAALLRRARSGRIQDLDDQGPEGSAEWSVGQPVPSCLLLHDLEAGALPAGFGSDAMFASVTELDLSGNRLQRLPPDVFANLVSLKTLFLGGVITEAKRSCLEKMVKVCFQKDLYHKNEYWYSWENIFALRLICSPNGKRKRSN